MTETIEDALMSIGGFDNRSECTFVHIPTERLEELAQYSTACGNVGNKPFRPDVIKLLKDAHAEAILLNYKPEGDPHVIGAFGLKAPKKVCRKFEDLIGAYDGSLRFEDASQTAGYWLFETE